MNLSFAEKLKIQKELVVLRTNLRETASLSFAEKLSIQRDCAALLAKLRGESGKTETKENDVVIRKGSDDDPLTIGDFIDIKVNSGRDGIAEIIAVNPAGTATMGEPAVGVRYRDSGKEYNFGVDTLNKYGFIVKDVNTTEAIAKEAAYKADNQQNTERMAISQQCREAVNTAFGDAFESAAFEKVFKPAYEQNQWVSSVRVFMMNDTPSVIFFVKDKQGQDTSTIPMVEVAEGYNVHRIKPDAYEVRQSVDLYDYLAKERVEKDSEQGGEQNSSFRIRDNMQNDVRVGDRIFNTKKMSWASKSSALGALKKSGLEGTAIIDGSKTDGYHLRVIEPMPAGTVIELSEYKKMTSGLNASYTKAHKPSGVSMSVFLDNIRMFSDGAKSTKEGDAVIGATDYELNKTAKHFGLKLDNRAIPDSDHLYDDDVIYRSQFDVNTSESNADASSAPATDQAKIKKAIGKAIKAIKAYSVASEHQYLATDEMSDFISQIYSDSGKVINPRLHKRLQASIDKAKQKVKSETQNVYAAYREFRNAGGLNDQWDSAIDAELPNGGMDLWSSDEVESGSEYLPSTIEEPEQAKATPAQPVDDAAKKERIEAMKSARSAIEKATAEYVENLGTDPRLSRVKPNTAFLEKRDGSIVSGTQTVAIEGEDYEFDFSLIIDADPQGQITGISVKNDFPQMVFPLDDYQSLNMTDLIDRVISLTTEPTEVEQPATELMSEADTLSRLENAGGTLWEKGLNRRVYFKASDINKWGGLVIGKNGSTLNGEPIDVARSKSVSASKFAKIYYDLNLDKFVDQGFKSRDVVDRALTHLEAVLAGDHVAETVEHQVTPPAATADEKLNVGSAYNPDNDPDLQPEIVHDIPFVADKYKKAYRDMIESEFVEFCAKDGIARDDAKDLYESAGKALRMEAENKYELSAESVVRRQLVKALRQSPIGEMVRVVTSNGYKKLQINNGNYIFSYHLSIDLYGDKDTSWVVLQNNHDDTWKEARFTVKKIGDAGLSSKEIDSITQRTIEIVQSTMSDVVKLPPAPEYGSRTDENLSTKQIAAELRSLITQAKKSGWLPKATKVGVKSDYNSIDVSIKDLPPEIPVFGESYLAAIVKNEDAGLDRYDRDNLPDNRERYSPEMTNIIEWLKDHLGAHHWDKSDAMTDYFHSAFYKNVGLDWSFSNERLDQEVAAFRARGGRGEYVNLDVDTTKDESTTSNGDSATDSGESATNNVITASFGVKSPKAQDKAASRINGESATDSSQLATDSSQSATDGGESTSFVGAINNDGTGETPAVTLINGETAVITPQTDDDSPQGVANLLSQLSEIQSVDDKQIKSMDVDKSKAFFRESLAAQRKIYDEAVKAGLADDAEFRAAFAATAKHVARLRVNSL